MSIHVALSAGGADLLGFHMPLPEEGSEGAIRQSIVHAWGCVRGSHHFWGVVYMVKFVALSFLNFPYYLADALR